MIKFMFFPYKSLSQHNNFQNASNKGLLLCFYFDDIFFFKMISYTYSYETSITYGY